MHKEARKKKILAFLAGHFAKGGGGGGSDPRQLRKAGRFKMKNCTFFLFFLNEVIHPHGRVILGPFKNCLFQFTGSAVYELLQGTFLILLKQFFMSKIAGFIYIKIIIIS